MSNRKTGGDTGDPILDLAIAELTDLTGIAGWSIVKKRKTLLKFGRRSSMTNGSEQTIWQAPDLNETYLTPADGNLIDTMSSSSASDTGEEVSYEGHYWDADNNLVFATGTSIINGQNKVTLNRAYCRINRAFDNNTVPFVGDINFYEDTALTNGVPTDTSKIHLTVKGTLGESQSFKAASSISGKDAYIVTALSVGALRNGAGALDFSLEARNAQLDSVFRPVFGRMAANTGGTSSSPFELAPPVLIGPNSDFRMVATPGANGMAGTATISGYLAIRPDPL
jgi:hypothetical protein